MAVCSGKGRFARSLGRILTQAVLLTCASGLLHAVGKEEISNTLARGARFGNPFLEYRSFAAQADESSRRALLEQIASKYSGTRWSGRARFLLGRLELDLGERDKALEHLQNPDIDLTFLRDYAHLQLVELLKEREQPARILDFLKTKDPAGRAPPLILLTQLHRAQALAALDKHAEASKVIADLVSAIPDGSTKVLALFTGAQVCEQLGDDQAALRFYEAIYYENPCVRLSTCAQCSGSMWRTAQEKVESSGRTHPAERLLQRAESLFACKEYKNALDTYDELKSHRGEVAKDVVDLRRAVCLFNLGQKRQAASLLARYSSTERERSREAAYYLARCKLSLGARTTYLNMMGDLTSTSRKIDPWGAKAHQSLALYFRERKRLKAAAYHQERSALRDPSRYRADEDLWKAAWYKYTHREYSGARRLMRSLRDVFPDSIYWYASLYWEARSYEATSSTDAALIRYGDLVERNVHGYYRLLALRRLKELGVNPADNGLQAADVPLVYRAKDEPEPPSGKEWIVTLRRIKALIEVGMTLEADREARQLIDTYPDSPFIHRAMATLLNGEGLLLDAIISLRKGYPALSSTGLPPGEWKILYPLEHWDLISTYSAKFDVSPFVIAGLARQESVFNKQAHSPAKAIGVMQIIPPTGKLLARRLALRPFSTEQLFDPKVNIQLGTYYFSELRKGFQGNLVDTLSAYNAGKGRVVRWRKTFDGKDEDEYVESIPFRETAWYVKNITLFEKAYEALYGHLR